MKKCRYEGCHRPVRARGLCPSHYRMVLAGEQLRPLKPYKLYPAPAPGKKICTACERVKDLEDFYDKSNGGKQSQCKNCMNAYVREYVRKIRNRKAAQEIN